MTDAQEDDDEFSAASFRVALQVFENKRTGHVNCAVNEVYIAALWESVKACLSWSDDWDAAEAEFKKRNPPDGCGENILGMRKC